MMVVSIGWRGRSLLRRPGPAAGNEPAQDGLLVVDLGPVSEILGTADRVVADLPGRALQVLIVRTGGGIFAVEPSCPHLGRRLDDALIKGATIVCRGHAACFDLRTGSARRPHLPASRPGQLQLRVYPAWVEQGTLRLRLPAC